MGISTELTSLPWQHFLGDPRIRRYLARPTLNFGSSAPVQEKEDERPGLEGDHF